jgi:quinol monooxygenase YgiN
MFIAITIHHQVPEHEQALRAFMDEVAADTAAAPGLLEFDTYRDIDGRFLAGFSRWETSIDFQEAVPAIRAHAPRRDTAWTSRPDEAIRLLGLPRTR